jgi:hypothetical protein
MAPIDVSKRRRHPGTSRRRFLSGLTAAALTGLVALLGTALAGTGDSGEGTPTKSPVKAYAGQTSQGEPVSLKASRRGLKFSLGWSALCDDGGEPFAGTTFNSKSLRLRKRGRFEVATSFTDEASDGAQVAYTVELSGRVKPKKSSGSWRIAAAGPDTEGGRWSCDTGAVTWSAPAGGKSGKGSSAAGTGIREPHAGKSLGLQTTTASPGTRAPASPAPSPPLPPPPPGPPTTLSGQVLFAQRDCYSGNAMRELPLANARIQLNPSGANPVEAPLDAQGRFQNVQVPQAERIEAFAITDGPRVTVAPDVDGAQPYLIPLGEVTTSNQVFRIGAIGSAPPQYTEGAANIYGVLEEGATVAAAASPVAIPKIRARWRYGLGGNWLGDRAGSAYDPNTNSIFVGGRQSPPTGDISGTPESVASARDEYEKLPLLHEYGHHVLETVAADPDSAAGNHSFSSVHSDNPGLPWSEGFANAFAAIVTGSPQQTLGCTTRLDLGAKPATARTNPNDPLQPMPPPDEKHFAQYNETAIAGALWGVVGHLGGGAAGLKRLMSALHNKPPIGSMRDARDALAEDRSIESTREQHEQITEILRDQRINWFVEVDVSMPNPFTTPGDKEIQFKMDGPRSYNDCRVEDEFADNAGLLPEEWDPGVAHGDPNFELAGEGGLPDTWHDDCFGISDGNPDSDDPGGPSDTFFVEFPYSGGSNPASEVHSFSVRYTCKSTVTDTDNCLSSVTAGIDILRGADVIESSGRHDPIRTHEVNNVTLPRNSWQVVLRVHGLGQCTSVLDGFDCSI